METRWRDRDSFWKELKSEWKKDEWRHSYDQVRVWYAAEDNRSNYYSCVDIDYDDEKISEQDKITNKKIRCKENASAERHLLTSIL